MVVCHPVHIRSRAFKLQVILGKMKRYYAMRIKLLFLMIALGATIGAQQSKASTFGGYECTNDCSGHAAGYKWAEEHSIAGEEVCPAGDSESFHEGCIVYNQDPYRGASEVDDGNSVQSLMRGRSIAGPRFWQAGARCHAAWSWRRAQSSCPSRTPPRSFCVSAG